MMLAKCAKLLAASTSITAADNYAALGKPYSVCKSIRFFAVIDQFNRWPSSILKVTVARSDKDRVNLSFEKLHSYSK